MSDASQKWLLRIASFGPAIMLSGMFADAMGFMFSRQLFYFGAATTMISISLFMILEAFE